MPLKHLIFALLLICASLFMSSLFTFAAARFTCCCRDYPAGQDGRFLLLEQLLWPVCFEHSQDSIKDSLNIFCLTDPFGYVCVLIQAVKLDALKSCFVLCTYLTGSCKGKEQTVTILWLACATVDFLPAPLPDCVWIVCPHTHLGECTGGLSLRSRYETLDYFVKKDAPFFHESIKWGCQRALRNGTVESF